MTREEKKQLLDRLKANPALSVVEHPNPEGIGPRIFVGVENGQIVFDRPDIDAKSFLTINRDDFTITPDGFTIMGGKVVYRFAKEVV